MLNSIFSKLHKWQNIAVIFLMLYFTNFFSWLDFESLPRSIVAPLVYILTIWLLKGSKYLEGKTMASMMKLTIISFFFSLIPTMFVFGQSLYAGLAGITMYMFPTLLYFLLSKWDTDEDLLFSLLILFTLVFGCMEIIQQFTYPDYLFSGRPETDEHPNLEERMGFLRFYVFGIDYCLLAIMLVFNRIMVKKGNFTNNLIFFLFCAVAIYFFLARKDIYATVSCIAIGIFLSSRSSGLFTKILIVALLFGAYSFLSTSMVDLNAQTSDELGEQGEDFIRFAAANYFMYDMSSSPLYYIFGAGVPGGNNSLSHLITYLTDTMHFYQDDCGFVGYFSKFGLFGLLVQILILVKIARNYKYINIGLLMFGLLQLEISFFDFWANNVRHLAAWSIYLYLVDKEIIKNKNKQKITEI